MIIFYICMFLYIYTGLCVEVLNFPVGNNRINRGEWLLTDFSVNSYELSIARPS